MAKAECGEEWGGSGNVNVEKIYNNNQNVEIIKYKKRNG